MGSHYVYDRMSLVEKAQQGSDSVCDEVLGRHDLGGIVPVERLVTVLVWHRHETDISRIATARKCQELHLSAVCSHRIRSLTSISHHVSAHFQGCLGRYEASRPFLRVSVVFMAATRRMCRMSKKVEELCQGLG